MVWIIGLSLLIICTVLFYASYSIRSGVYLKAFCGVKTERKIVSLTFDDGPDPLHTPRVLDILKKYNVSATFFCIGEKAQAHPALIQRIVREGHLAGNHSWAHTAYFPLLCREKMYGELVKTQVLLEELTGQPVTLFRPPFGVTNPVVAAVTKKLALKVVGWNIRSFDTRGERTEKIIKRITRQLKPGAVVLLHDRLPQSGELLEKLLQYLNAENYEVVRIDEMSEL